jgi:hypothetical protein
LAAVRRNGQAAMTLETHGWKGGARRAADLAGKGV